VSENKTKRSPGDPERMQEVLGNFRRANESSNVCHVKIKLLPGGKMPKKAHDDDACYDVYSRNEVVFGVRQRALIQCGFCLEMPKGWRCDVRPRSGLPLHEGLVMLNAPGTIDAGYRGEVMAGFINLYENMRSIKVGDRIAQIMFERVKDVEFEQVSELSPSDRGTGGHGSTGR
jgi:dUTP pyrophosphatase